MFNWKRTTTTVKGTGRVSDSFDKAMGKLNEAMDALSDSLDKVFSESMSSIVHNDLSVKVGDGKVIIDGKIEEIVVNGQKIDIPKLKS